MALISKSVGEGGQNDRRDVIVVQRLLNKHSLPPLRSLTVDGIAGKNTIDTIRHFQSVVVKMHTPDGRVDPGGKTLRSLNRGPSTPERSRQSNANVGTANLSGTRWWRANQSRYPNSTRLEDLEDTFGDNTRRFVRALRDAGATVSISSTRRDRIRAHLMHYSWKLSRGEVMARNVPQIAGLNIEWDHGDEEASRRAAGEMVRLFGLAYIASLTSNHIVGKAIDMTISWRGVLRIRLPNGANNYSEVSSGPRDGGNRELHRIGREFRVIKLISDPPHWSYDGC